MTRVLGFLIALSTTLALAAPASATDHHRASAVRDKTSQASGLIRGAGSGARSVNLTINTRARSTPLEPRDFRANVRSQGYEPTKGSFRNIKVSKGKYWKFIRTNLRHNLSARTGYTRIEHDAHHLMPVKFEPYFRERGINIHKPKYARWWWKYSHRSNAPEYNRQWERWINKNRNASKSDVLRRARKMDRRWHDKYDPPGPIGCQKYDCRPARSVA